MITGGRQIVDIATSLRQPVANVISWSRALYDQRNLFTGVTVHHFRI